MIEDVPRIPSISVGVVETFYGRFWIGESQVQFLFLKNLGEKSASVEAAESSKITQTGYHQTLPQEFGITTQTWSEATCPKQVDEILHRDRPASFRFRIASMVASDTATCDIVATAVKKASGHNGCGGSTTGG